MPWNRGDVVTKRILWHDRVWAAWPDIVVEDTPERVILYTAPGSPWIGPCHPHQNQEWATIEHIRANTWGSLERIWSNPTLIIMPTGAWHELVLWFEGDRFHSYKVNLQTPFVRTATGFDTRDLFLDIEVLPDMRWRWLDEDELAEARGLALVSDAEEEAIWAEGRRVVEQVEQFAAPFCDGWDRWRPDPSWTAPVVPAGWADGS